MKNLIFLIVLSSTTLLAKEVYFADAEGVKTSETVDPSIKLWYIKDYVFRLERINPKRFALGIKTSKGYDRPDVEKALSEFGESENGPVLFYIVPIDLWTGELKDIQKIKLASEEKPCVCPASAPCPAAATPVTTPPPAAPGATPDAATPPPAAPGATPDAATTPPAAPAATPPVATIPAPAPQATPPAAATPPAPTAATPPPATPPAT